MSQRLFSTLLAFVIFIAAGVVAATQHVLPPLSDIGANILTFVTPAIGTLVILNTWLDVLDAKVADGTLKAGEIAPLLKMPDFYTAMVSVLVGALQTFGLKAIDTNTQALIVNGLLTFSIIVLRSFTDRTPKSEVTVEQSAKALSAKSAVG